MELVTSASHGSRIPILLIEDDPTDALRVRRCLRQTGFHLIHTTTLRSGIEHLGARRSRAVLLDLHLPDADGVEAVEELLSWQTEHSTSVPVVVVTGDADAEAAESALRAGAQDYIHKDAIDSRPVLERAIRYACERHAAQQRVRELERRIQHTEHLEGLGVLGAGLGSVLHSLAEAVTEQTDAALYALGEGASPATIRRHLIAMRKSVLATDELSRRLRSWVEPESGETAIDVSQFVLERLEMLEALVADRAELVCELPSGLPRVACNPLDLRQLLVVLVANAAEASPSMIRIHTDVRDVDAAYLSECENGPLLTPGRYVAISVDDSGTGMLQSARAHAFDPFGSTRVPGRGLGLFFALSIVRRHGGAIHAASEIGRGSCFTVLLPAS